jgi:hypothetical protein
MSDDAEVERGPEITHEKARESARRLINSAFQQEPRARLGIPARPGYDDDLVIVEYIKQQAALRPAPPAQDALVEAIRERDEARATSAERKTTIEMIEQSLIDASFQSRVQPWLLACFGAEIAGDKVERNHRFFEEATETVQAGGMTRSEAHQLVDYTYDRPTGDLRQEVGGAMNTLAALCLAHGLDMHAAGELELARVWTKVDVIRAKQAAKPRHSPLPEAPSSSVEKAREAVIEAYRRLASAKDADEYYDLLGALNHMIANLDSLTPGEKAGG